MSLKDIVSDTIVPLGNTINVLLMTLAFLFFMYGVFKYFFLNSTDPKGREDGRMFMIWGVIGLAILFSIWGLVNTVISIIPT